MTEILTPLLPEYTINLPEDPAAWILWFVIFGVLIVFVTKLREKPINVKGSGLIWIAILSISILVFTPFLGIPIEIEVSYFPGEVQTRYLMFFAALPWMAAGGVVGILPASLLAGMSGLLFAYLETHHIFTPLVFMSLAVLFSWGIRQRYRTTFFCILRLPPFSALFALIAATPLIFLTQILILSVDFPLRIAIASARMPTVLSAYAGMLGVGSIICSFIFVILPKKWGGQASLIPAPGEKSIQTRFLLTVVPVLILLFCLFSGMVWHKNVVSSRRQLVSRLVRTSELAAKGWTVFIDTGLTIFDSIDAQIQQTQGSDSAIDLVLSEEITRSAFFDALTVISLDGSVVARESQDSFATPVEIPDGLLSHAAGLESGTSWVVSTQNDSRSPMVSFLRFNSGADQVEWVLWGEAAVADNRFSQQVTGALASLAEIDGGGEIISTSGAVLYSTNNVQDFGIDRASVTASPTYVERASADGGYLMQYLFPVENSDWVVVTSLPASGIYSSAWDLSAPSLLLGLGAFTLIVSALLLFFSPVVKDINLLTEQMKSAVENHFKVDLSEARSKGELSSLFEQVQMLSSSLGKQLQEQEALLTLEEQLAARGNLQDSLQTIMTAALERGISSVRIVVKNTTNKTKFKLGKAVYSLGEDVESYAPLDEALASVVRSQGEVMWRDFQIMQNLPQSKGMPTPASLCALPLEWKGADLGLFWAASDTKRSMNVDDIDFLRTLSSKAAMLIAKGMTYDHALALQDQLESVLKLLSDGILLLDSTDRVIFHNQAAHSLFATEEDAIDQHELSSFINDQPILEHIKTIKTQGGSKDLMMADDKTYRLISTPIELSAGQTGNLLVFKDITSIKNQESIQSEYVITASHELRSPLALIHGYAKLLRVTGNLNEQQDAYITNIIDGIEEMKMLVTNLLDIERLEAGNALEIKRFNALDLAKSVINHMQTQAKQKNIRLALNLPDAAVVIEGDETFLSQALKNLIDNAIKFTKIGGDVSLTLRKNEDSVVFTIKDNGIGIAPLDQRHLFEKFTHVSSGLGQESRGSGLGLAIVKSIVERHGGKVWFESQLGQGSTFSFEIPMKQNRNTVF